MITKAGSRTYEAIAYPSMRPRLSAMERGLLKWAVIDRDDRVLDVGLGNGLMVDYLRRNMECEVCGVSDNMELVRQTRSLVCSADLVYAAPGDIPWRDGAFHSVLMRSRRMEAEGFRMQMEEVKRVLKDGGQLVLGIECLPRRQAEDTLAQLGFEHFSWERVSFDCGVLICWKHTRNEAHPETEN